MIAALFVETNGVYYGLPDVEPWDKERDARLYPGPYPVVAHPPCARWGAYWYGGPLLHKQGRRKKLGDDEGLFATALAAVRRWGGILEHPAYSHAWPWYGIPKPPNTGGWISDLWGGWTCHVEQGHYGHRARKATWLYAVGIKPSELIWGPSEAKRKISDMWHSKEERDRAIKTGACQLLGHRERAATPIPFRDLLLNMLRDNFKT
jgi:hypothetical protein